VVVTKTSSGFVSGAENEAVWMLLRDRRTISIPTSPVRTGHVAEADRGDQERNGGSLATPAGWLYAKAAISVAADWRLTVAGAASGPP
jgi:hypothetical protein